MKAIDHEPASLWVKRKEDGAIVSDFQPGETIFESRDRLLMSSGGEVQLSLQDIARSNLLSRSSEKLALPIRLERLYITNVKTVETSTVKTTTYEGVRTAGDVVLESPRSNLEGAWVRDQPSRMLGATWVTLGAVFGVTSLYMLNRSRELSEDSRSDIQKIAAGVGVVSLTGIIWGSYLLLAPETRTPLR